MKKHFFFIATLFLLLCACGPGVTEMPIEPDFLVHPEEYRFGHETSLRDTQAWTTVFDEAKLVYPGDIRVEMREISAETDWAELETHYETVLLAEAGWEKETRFTDLWNQAQITAFRNGDNFIAIVGLKPEYEEGGWLPVKIITNIPES
jgi:hypothetical protein